MGGCFGWDTYTCLPYFWDLLYLAKERCTKIWHEYFDERSRNKCIWYKTIQTEPPGTSCLDSIDIGRRDTMNALRFRPGHMPLKNFARLMGKVQSPNRTEGNRGHLLHHYGMRPEPK